MQWPNRAEYAEAVRDYPHVSLQDPKLKGGKPRRGKDNFVISDTGAFSIVFPIDMVSKTFALRCWVKEVGNVKNRYEKISTYLKQVRLPYFVDFEYVSEGILVNGTKYPITRMEWVEGVSLREFIEQNLQEARILKVVATEFQKMVTSLHKHRIAHGDLQDGNILIKQNGTDVEIKLIDYDSLFVPTLQGQPDQIVGLPEYQHLQRIAGGRQASEKVDYFSELVIYLSFLALAEKPELWNQFKDKTERGLLFSKEDFENPDQADVFKELEKLSPDVQQLAATLKDFCAKASIDELAPLEAILPKPDAIAYSNRGFSYLNDKRYAEALTEFQKAIDIKPDYEKAHFGRGHVYRRTKRYADAINAFQQAIKFKPNYKEAYHGLGVTYFESGDNSKATAAANAALGINPHYQPARELLAAIKSAPKPPGPVPPPPAPTPWQYVIDALKSNWHAVTSGTLGLALVICFIAFVIQMNTKNAALSQNAVLTKQLTQKESEIHQTGLEIQSLTSSIQALKSANRKLSRDNSELEKKLGNRTPTTNMTLRRQLNNQIDKNQELLVRLTNKDTEIRQLRNDKTAALNENQKLKKQLVVNNPGSTDQAAIIQRLREEKTETLTENRNLQKRLTDKTLEAKKLTERVQQLQTEKIKIQRQNQQLQSENEILTRQNQNSRDKNTALRDQQDKTNQTDANTVGGPEPLKKIQNVTSGAESHNNQGVIAVSNRKDYDKAIAHFKTAIKMESELAIAHYNLGCLYLRAKEYSKAISAFNEAVGVNSKFKEAYYNLGLAHLGKGVHKQAKSSIELSLKIDKDYKRARNLLTAIENAQR